MIGRGLPVHEMLGGVGAKYDGNRLNWIGSMNNEVSVCVTYHTSKVKTLDDLMKTEAIFGTQGASSDTEVFAVFLKNLHGAKVKAISGYPGTKETALAMERGEVDGMCGWSWSSLKHQQAGWLKDKKINILLQMALSKHKDLPDVPLITELTTDPEKLAQTKLVFSRQTMGRPLVAPQDIPPARVAALRAAFDATLKDPEFIAYAEKAKMEVDAVSGAEVQALVASVLATPKDIVEKTKANLNSK
jgi:tripartite-type tricarboxylate transporter receptor subunit TctC